MLILIYANAVALDGLQKYLYYKFKVAAMNAL